MIACVAPTSPCTATTTEQLPQPTSSPTLTESSAIKVNPETQYAKILFSVLEQGVEEGSKELESAFIFEETRPLFIPGVSTPLMPYTLPETSSVTPVIRRDCGVDACIQTRDTASSPHVFREMDENEDLECSEDHPDAEGLELDEEGVYFAFDYNDHPALYIDHQDHEGCEDILEGMVKPRQSCSEETRYSEGLSDLVDLTTSISVDLLQLESGCQELIHRVHANRIELGRVNDSLSFVWDNKDEYTGSVSRSSIMEQSSRSCDGDSADSISTHRYSPLGASFISFSGSCCRCSCHLEEIPSKPESLSEVLSTSTIVQSDSFPNDELFQVNDNSTLRDTINHHHKCTNSSCCCLMPDSTTKTNH